MASLLYSEPLYIYNIPTEVLAQLQLRPSPLAPHLAEGLSQEPQSAYVAASSLNALACTLCVGASFTDIQDQRTHFRSDRHRYNVKLRLQNSVSQPVDEAQFSNLVEGLEDSLSGSESTDSNGSQASESHDKVTALLQKTRLKDGSRSPSPQARSIPKHPIVWFTSPRIPETQFGVYSTVFHSETLPSSYVEELVEMQGGGEYGGQWTVFMTAGGHFSGAVVRMTASNPTSESASAPKKQKNAPKPVLEVIRHKTFHRYTTRRKQGGSQSVNDNAKGPAKSAGAQLRRYGEQALKEDIRGLLTEWRDEIDASGRIFIRANTSNRRIFLDFDDSPIQKGDPRLRTFPFPTRRPTQSELMRCVNELIKVKISHLTEEALAAQDQALIDSIPQPKPKPVAASTANRPVDRPAAPRLTKEEERARDLFHRLLEMVRKGRLEALKTFWEKNGLDLLTGVDAPLPEWLEGKDSGAGGTLLQVAAASGQPEIVRWLLEDLRADPTITIPSSFSRYREEGEALEATAYDLSSNPETRNVFRRLAYSHPDWCDWLGKARIRSVLTPEMEAKQQREEAKRAKMRERARERELSQVVPEASVPAPVHKAPAPARPGAPQKVGGGSGSEMQAVAGLTPEMRAKIERERRARAAEARLRGIGGK